ncbi:T3SS (YopN, CesT) and YbjN peptide-binding chaperone 1 [Nocardioides mesophilus]|uniref:YbjN domain-containing protein n=1 Tax=Nocardioides mesophilus TaxID=433659 RepID=A0A7G9R9T1_9ACTN|nr:YbjN domain-containing protein [Nocardioides mesophilus]QNN52356.1 YbjN domain-containing protein [Nocardioides mesophilus]
MSEFAGFDLDRSTERAWSRFRARLADHVAEMADDDVLVVSVDDSAVDEDGDGATPYVQFCGWGGTRVRCEVSSNAYLADELQLDRAGSESVLRLGWAAPTAGRSDELDGGSANYFLDLDRAHADRLAVMTTQVLREVFAVPHPAFLSAEGLGDDAGLDRPDPATATEPEVEVPAVFPHDREHLLDLVDKALVPLFGQPPEHDEDDDIPVVSGSALIFVRVLETAPAVQLFCSLVHDVTDRDRAAFEVAVLNRDVRYLKFVLVEDTVMVQLHLPAYPFAPEHLRTMLSIMSDTVDTIDDDLVARVGGRRTFEPDSDVAGVEDADIHQLLDLAERREVEAATDPVHPAMMTLLQLDADSPGSLTGEIAASVCSGERDLILELIAWSSGQELAWRQARDRAILAQDAAEAAVCERETRQAEAMVDVLRRALRLVVEAKLGRDRLQPGYAGQSGRGSGRPAEQDVTLPGLEVPVDEPGLFDED